jgi:hypothetical protein
VVAVEEKMEASAEVKPKPEVSTGAKKKILKKKSV